ncbi:MAG: S41 family peptidase [Clostridia bacterium]|nr:S41 family peptidase [Clostridia bacterium]
MSEQERNLNEADPSEKETVSEEPLSEEASSKKPKKERKYARISLLLAVFIALLLCLATFLATYAVLTLRQDAETASLRSELARFSKLDQILDTLSGRYVNGADESERMENAYYALFDDLDPYSFYMSADEYNAFRADRSAQYAGIGANVTMDPETEGLYVYRVLPNGPADRAGLKAGDIITAVEGIDVQASTYAEAVAAVAGEPDTPVSLTLLRDGNAMALQVIRGTVESRSVWYSATEDGIAVIEITDFSASYVVDQFKAALEKAKQDGCKAYLFDVRDNPGGDLTTICSALDLLLPEGPIIHIVTGAGEERQERIISSDANRLVEGPMAVLCNGKTASAAELFTADLKEYGLASVIGVKTYGKGTVQSVFTCSDGSAYKLTTSYYTPKSGTGYNGIGILPDTEVTLSDDPNANRYRMSKDEDRQWQEAVRQLRAALAD